MNVSEFIAANRITIRCNRIPSRGELFASDWAKDARHWSVCLADYASKHSTFTFHFSQGSAHTAEPTAEDTLECLISDAQDNENYINFEDWAEAFGYDSDSRKAERLYNYSTEQAERFTAWLAQFGVKPFDIERECFPPRCLQR